MGRHAQSVIAGLVLAGVVGLAPRAAAGQTATAPSHARLHLLSPWSAGIMEEGLRRSATLRQLVGELDASDLIVFVNFQTKPGFERGQTKLIGATGGARYVSVVVNLRLNPEQRLEILGHELQHAVEIARAPEVRDGAALAAYLRLIGRPGRHSAEFETEAAQATERLVRADLARHAGKEQREPCSTRAGATPWPGSNRG